MATNLDKPLPELKVPESHNSLSQNITTAVPKRKPVPVTKTATAAIPDATAATTVPDVNHVPRRGCLDWRRYSRKKRLLLIGIIIGAVCLIALIIGLAVGLTRGRSHSNLPLPTSHGGPYTGDLTYYDPALGSCGISSSSSDHICAVSHKLFDAASKGSNPNENPLCGLKLRLRRNGESVDVKVVDRCVGCKETDLDVSRAVFNQVADLDLGRVVVEWAWLEDSPIARI
ncbi:hypothetical protein ASPWEDRAFT_181996 [Aspergillus wentii DTO 134E9]|uniref:RlpA-like protein double-psi beta-barrel domain-containing protein n=1 Tax=Aspergillus wentii DTO 134E9 TaxID=1073089 RepID=A0A1L9RQ84_ASPWE|nr:uncharacterized protein ASPWEDRAFT_181996 [Aspergillus wentii DTO 134E9]KAI9928418.1 hypothetical protein MW887_002462 [Aspergillus wentii]OJJ37091.1 hypothetical protein ASPWEDRAFT_181996 [Aspergillus wentii DTO 134E9]